MKSGTTYEQDRLDLEQESMTNDQIMEFALALLHGDSEAEIIEILRQYGYWEDHGAWRLYGDKEGNFAQVGNQQSYPEAALAEKITNSIDSRLLLECLRRGIEPESEQAPTSIRDAVAMFFENRRATDNEAGTLTDWGTEQRNAESHKITVAATGAAPTRGRRPQKMCLTICDQGEGQSPKRLPDTILSLNKKNKQRIRFVQGKFNMGGSGALRFCGSNGIQLVISKRHPDIADPNDPTADRWGVTVVRREEPSNKSGDPVHSEFTYLAPVGANERPRQGEVLSFTSETLSIMPDADQAYARAIQSGTAIKLYEYETSVGQSNVLMKDGVLYALDRLLPQVALPLRIHECRSRFKGGDKKTTPASFHTRMEGLAARLEGGKGQNLEPGFPLSSKLYAAGTSMTARIYAFKADTATTYLKDEGVIFQINGQAHGYIPKSIFSRPKKVKLPRLKDSLLVLIDCSELTARQREDLFMSSRDRLSKKTIRFEIEAEIEEMLRTNQTLKKLQTDRRQQEIDSKLSDEKPLEEVLNKVLRASPTLKTLFLAGQRLSKPFDTGKPMPGSNNDGPGNQPGPTPTSNDTEYVGKKHPTKFEVFGVKYGKVFKRNCEIGRRSRIKFKTDVENQYFDRPTDQGTFEVEIIDNEELTAPTGFFSLDDGDAFLNFTLPAEARVGDEFTLQVTIDDSTLTEPFVNLIHMRVLEKQDKPPSPPRPRPKKPGASLGTGMGISLPKVQMVETDDDNWKRLHFTPETACVVESDPVEIDGKEVEAHVFFINKHNSSLRTEMKYSRQNAQLLESKFKYANVLFGLAMLHAESQTRNDGDDDDAVSSVQDRIRAVTQAVAPVLLPIIDQLSGLEEDELDQMSMLAEDA